MISIDLSETAHFAHWKSETFETNFFPRQKNFFLDFVPDYIPQLYFVCNHLIRNIVQHCVRVYSSQQFEHTEHECYWENI